MSKTLEIQNIDDEKEFEERADNIKDDDLSIWNVQNDHFTFIQKKLLATGAKLIIGPRGTGKTHQMRIVYKQCLVNLDKKEKPIAIFASFGKYFFLEPLLSKAPNALQIFHTWVLCKIVDGYIQFLKDSNSDITLNLEEDEVFNRDNISDFIDKAEKLNSQIILKDSLIKELSISKIVGVLENFAIKNNKPRIILLLDDAALTFTPDYLIEFFDIFRSLKTKIISPKASVYPGTTQYGPRFHIGQDAEPVNCWLSTTDTKYIGFMNSLLEKRFAIYNETKNKTILEIFKFCSFGIPRAFISLLRNYYSLNSSSLQAKFNKVLTDQIRFIETEYKSFSIKIPQYKDVISTGSKFFQKILLDIKEANKNLKSNKIISIGIDENSVEENRLSNRMIRFLIEAGLLYEDTPVKHGTERVYRRFIPHLLFLINNRTFSTDRGFNPEEIINKLFSNDQKHPVRRTITSMLSESDLVNLKISLPPCSSCGTNRLTEEQKFCHNCGNELIKKSAFENCMNISIDELPITEKSKKKIREKLNIKTIGQILVLQDPGTELQKVDYIGPVKSNKIYEHTKTLIEEFLT